MSQLESFIFSTNNGMNVPAGSQALQAVTTYINGEVSQPFFWFIPVPDMNQLVVFHTRGD
jgi:hypothetical protein